MSRRFLYHVSMNSGHSRRSYRDEVDDESIEWARHALYVGIDRKELVPLELMGPGYRLWISPPENNRALKCCVLLDTTPVVTFGIAEHSRAGAGLWRDLITTTQTPIADIECPPVPWIAARLEIGAATVADSEALLMIGDMERCIGWAFLERDRVSP